MQTLKHLNSAKKQENRLILAFAILILGFGFFVFTIPQAQAACVSGASCPAGQVEDVGPCPPDQINCIPTPATTSESASTTVSLPNPLGTEDIRIVIGRIIQILMSAIGAIALMILIYGGFNWLTAMGNPEKIKKGKDIMLWTLIGVVIMFSSYFIVRFIIIALTKGTGAIPPANF